MCTRHDFRLVFYCEWQPEPHSDRLCSKGNESLTSVGNPMAHLALSWAGSEDSNITKPLSTCLLLSLTLRSASVWAWLHSPAGSPCSVGQQPPSALDWCHPHSLQVRVPLPLLFHQKGQGGLCLLPSMGRYHQLKTVPQGCLGQELTLRARECGQPYLSHLDWQRDWWGVFCRGGVRDSEWQRFPMTKFLKLNRIGLERLHGFFCLTSPYSRNWTQGKLSKGCKWG